MATTQTTQAAPIPLPSSDDEHRGWPPAGDWHVDPAQSELAFLTHIMFGFIPVRGRFSGYDDDLHIDDAGNASGVLHTEAETISAGIKQRDTHLRSTDFFAADLHPHLRFELTSLLPDADGGLILTGSLRIRDQVLAIGSPVSMAAVGSDGLRIDANFEVDHRAPGFESERLPRSVRVRLR